MIDTFLKQLRRLVGDVERHSYLLAVSGGADSCVMAHLFRAAHLRFAVAHCNFHLRGADSDDDMRLVEQMARAWNVPLLVQEFDTPALHASSGLSVEMLARQLRYDWFEEIGGDYDYLVTAHQADDAAETMLLNLCRGTGLKGLLSIPEKNGKIIRPMLAFSARQVRDYAEQMEIPYAIDRTNADETIQRNRIRHSVLPQLALLNPNVVGTLSRDREIFQMQYNFYIDNIQKEKQRFVRCEQGVCTIQASALSAHPHARILLYEILRAYLFPASVIDALLQGAQTGKRFFSPQYVLIVNREEWLITARKTMEDAPVTISSMEQLRQYFTIQQVENQFPDMFPKDNRVLFLPARKLTFPMVLRHWQTGDSFYPLGGKGKKRVSDFFTDHKIDGFSKKKIPLLCIGDDIVWIVGWRSSEKYKLKPTDTSYFIFQYNGLY